MRGIFLSASPSPSPRGEDADDARGSAYIELWANNSDNRMCVNSLIQPFSAGDTSGAVTILSRRIVLHFSLHRTRY